MQLTKEIFIFFAKKSVLSQKLTDKKLIIVEDFSFKSGKTKDFIKIIKDFDLANQKTTVLLNEIEDDAQVRLFNGDWDKIIVREVTNKKFIDLEGLSIKDIAIQNNINPLDWLLNHSLTEDGMDTLFIAMLLNSDEEAVGRLLKHPRSNITLSDAGAHLTFFNDAGYGLYMLEKWVREKNLMSKEKAIYNLTGKQADIYRIDQRGRLVPGQYADMMLIDFDKVGVSKTYRVNDLPGGSSRLNIDGQGIHSVWINGEKVFSENSIINKKILPGKVLRGFHA